MAEGGFDNENTLDHQLDDDGGGGGGGGGGEEEEEEEEEEEGEKLKWETMQYEKSGLPEKSYA